MSSYKIIDVISSGNHGTTYLAKKNSCRYVVKVQKILNTCEDLSADYWRELFMMKRMNKYPDHFLQLKEWFISKNCDLEQDYYEFGDDEYTEHIARLKQSKLCINFVTDLKDGTIDKILRSMSERDFYSFIIQMSYAIFLMRKEGFTHNDIHNENIAYKKTDKKYVKIFEKDIPTFGYIYSLIDYGENIHKKYILDELEEEWISEQRNSEVLMLAYVLLDFETFDDIINNKNVSLNHKKIDEDINSLFGNNNSELNYLAMRVLYKERFFQMHGVESYTDNVYEYINNIHTIFLITNNTRIKTTINYFARLLSEH